MNITGINLRGANIQGQSLTPSVTTDSYFNLVSLLLPGNGTNGAQNNTFLDSSTNNFSITRNGNPTQGSFSPYSQTGWSNYFDGTGDYLTVPYNSAWDFGTGDFTIESWLYPTTSGTVRVIAASFTSSGNDGWSFELTTGNLLTFYAEGFYIATSSDTVPANSWTHVAVSRSGSSLKLFVNGVQSGSVTYSTSIAGFSGLLAISATQSGTAVFTGYQSNVRIVKGTAVYTSAFTPPTAPLTAISGTSLLTCQSNRFIDNSTNAFAITVAGNTAVQAFSPFDPTAAYAASTVGGSGYFDGSGDDLMVADNAALEFGSGDFTIEAWIYPIASPGTYAAILSKYAAGFQDSYYFVLQSTRQIRFGISAQEVTTTTAVPLNAWSHVAATRNGNTFTIWINGVSSGTFTNSASVKETTARTGIGNFDGYSVYFNGYISNARIVKGTAVYTSAFTPPTAPLTAVTNTSLLCNFTNAGIYDATAKNVMETVGSAQISTTRSKFGSSSIYLTGSSDVVQLPRSELFAVYAGDFTVECWVNYAALPSGYTFIFQTYDGTNEMTLRTGDSGFGYVVQAVLGTGAGAVYTSSYTRSDLQNVWTHLAFCRTGTTARFFYNGVLQSSKTSSVSMGLPSAGYPTIGLSGYSPTAYIQDLRFTKGLGRYTANFTPPTQAFPTQ